MTQTTVAPSAITPALPGPHAVHRPLGLTAVRLTGGSLATWQQLNATVTIPHCITQLEESGVLDNLRRVVGESGAEFRGMIFADSDLYKVIEAVAWEIARTGTTAHDPWLDDVISLVDRVQEPSGFVNSWIQGVHPEKRFAELEWTHEMYVAGHLIQAAVALARANGRTDLLDIARRFADLLVRRFGEGREDGICGHPQIETALVELYRLTKDRAYLDLAARMIELRGRGLLKVGSFGARYFQDHAPVRDATSAVGHAVRQLYLNAGVTDVYLEEGDGTLLEAMDAQWVSAHARKMYITGAFGARHRDEAFGDDYELPSERAYAETCATIADLHWSWRMLLAGGAAGPAEYAQTIEREVHNALSASVDATGTRFFYANPLQVRPDRYSEESAPRQRTPWYLCACCPPNIARVVAQMSTYVATTTPDTLWLHLLADAEIDLPSHLGSGTVTVRTAYPAEGRVEISVSGQIDGSATLAVRVPTWSPGSALIGAGAPPVSAATDGYARVPLQDGSRLVLDLDLAPRVTAAHHRVDAVRGCRAIERGPLVYCVEQADLPDDVALDDIVLQPETIEEVDAETLRLHCHVRPSGGELYATAPSEPAGTLEVTAVPFSTWGNRGAGAMRVWLPVEQG